MSSKFVAELADKAASLVPRTLPVMTADAASPNCGQWYASGDLYCRYCVKDGFDVYESCYTFDG